ncbi:MAG: zinc ribbon domain-containing protein [Clostridia bacterium]|nr:zinc ribbon domain-containing protein [Clostridia bacterium]
MKAISAFTKIAVLIALIAFCFPFVVVSCSGKTVEVSGLDFLKGSSSAAAQVSEDAEDRSEPNFVLLAAVGSGIAAFALSFREYGKIRSFIGAALCSLSAVMLLIFKSNLYDMILTDDLKSEITETMFRLMTRIGWGWKLSLAAFILGAVGMLAAVILVEVTVRRPLPYAALCPFCGSSVSAQARFCSACGSSLRRSCPFCGTENPTAADFCTACGKEIPHAEDHGIESADNMAESANDAAEAAGEETEAKEEE